MKDSFDDAFEAMVATWREKFPGLTNDELYDLMLLNIASEKGWHE